MVQLKQLPYFELLRKIKILSFRVYLSLVFLTLKITSYTFRVKGEPKVAGFYVFSPIYLGSFILGWDRLLKG